MKTLKNTIRLISLLILSVTVTYAAKGKSHAEPAVEGYDLVSYHQAAEPVRGTEALTVEYEGERYLFANEANLAAFRAQPEQYLPAYGGYCAYGVALGKKFSTDPTVYEIVNGQLYLNYDAGVQQKWAKDKTGYIQKANEKWVEIR